MVRRQISTQGVSAFTASGVIKGKKIRVVQLPELTRQQVIDGRYLGNAFRSVGMWKQLPADITEPVYLPGTRLPAKFRAYGYGVDVFFQVGVVNIDRKSRFAITQISIGRNLDESDPWIVSDPVELSTISIPGLLRLAIQASQCVGIAYPPGWCVDIDTRKHLGTFSSGQYLLEGVKNVQCYGGLIKRDPDNGRLFVYGLSPVPDVILWDIGGKIDAQTERELLGLKASGRKQERGSMTDPKVLKLVAKLYTQAEKGTDGLSKPVYVQRELVKYGKHVSESWVRQVGVNARKAGLLKTGNRKVAK